MFSSRRELTGLQKSYLKWNGKWERQVNTAITWQGNRWDQIQVETAMPEWTAAWLRPGTSGTRSGGLPESGLLAKQKQETSNSP